MARNADLAYQDYGGMLLSEVAEQCGIPATRITGVYPCNPLQEEMMDLSLQGRVTQFAHEQVRLWPDLDLGRFKKAWEEVVQRHAVLRTRFVQNQHDGKLRQVVIDEGLHWETPRGFDDYMSTNFSGTLQAGQRLARWALYRDAESQDVMLIMSLHHSLFDGITLRDIFRDQYMAYLGQPLSKDIASFSQFVHVAKLRDEAGLGKYWGEYLAGWEEAGKFPLSADEWWPSLSKQYQPRADKGAMRIVLFEGGGMRAIVKMAGAEADYLAWNLLVVQPMLGGGGRGPSMLGGDGDGDSDRPFPAPILCGPRIDPAAMAPFNPFPLLTECNMMDKGVVFRVSFDDNIMRADQIKLMLDELANIIRTLPGQLDDALDSVV